MVPSPGRRTLCGHPRRYRTGFTLLELLIVVSIIGLISAVAVLSMGPDGGEQLLEREAQRIRQLFGLAAQDAILEGREIGVLVEEGGYRFLSAGQTEWQELKADDLLRPRRLPKGWRLEWIDGGPEAPPAVTDEEQGKPRPQIIFFSTGEATPYQLKLYAEPKVGAYVLEAQEDGALEIVARMPGI